MGKPSSLSMTIEKAFYYPTQVAEGDGSPTKMFKDNSEKLTPCKIWSDESMCDVWKLSVLYLIHKKTDLKVCAKFRGNMYRSLRKEENY